MARRSEISRFILTRLFNRSIIKQVRNPIRLRFSSYRKSLLRNKNFRGRILQLTKRRFTLVRRRLKLRRLNLCKFKIRRGGVLKSTYKKPVALHNALPAFIKEK